MSLRDDMKQEASFVDIDWAGRSTRIETQWISSDPLNVYGGRGGHDAPLIIFLHEGLGSVSMWRDFPQRVCEASACRGLVYSRPGYGRSTPRSVDEVWEPDFMHRQANEVLPALLAALGIDTVANRPWLLGHSDGGSIALLYAASHPQNIAGAIVLAPHILVEEVSVRSIAKARTAYLETDLKQRLARHHDHPDSAFWGWNDIWLKPAFRHWSIENEIPRIGCPLLAVQGLNDEYGTLEQIYGIARRAPQTKLLELSDCGHSPHRDQAEKLAEAIAAFIQHSPSVSSIKP